MDKTLVEHSVIKSLSNNVMSFSRGLDTLVSEMELPGRIPSTAANEYRQDIKTAINIITAIREKLDGIENCLLINREYLEN